MDRPTRSDSYPNPLSLTEFGCNLTFVSVILKCKVERLLVLLLSVPFCKFISIRIPFGDHSLKLERYRED